MGSPGSFITLKNLENFLFSDVKIKVAFTVYPPIEYEIIINICIQSDPNDKTGPDSSLNINRIRIRPDPQLMLADLESVMLTTCSRK